ncbi:MULTISPECIES: hypothetical protein [Rhodococcus]|uniref:Lipoprotein n=1 Tax=Rhodococcus rhodochrous TaxID=1829 RepID=A0AAW4XN30_RHORH|nr:MULTISPECIES: hypothetical protein [Rhodococcus]MCD2114311.1 hypothetical protein [Rhodococcus rhodochrous]MCZ1075229.1 hypothetical protein [Rhodococcus sp. A5(2022)]QHG85262.1 hypothetical protein D1O33_24675 [Rhodococcus rhodochrous]
MKPKNLVVTLITAALAVGVVSCGRDEPAAPTPTVSPSTSAAPTAVSVFGEDTTDLVYKINKQNATAIVEAVEERGGTPEQAVAALLAGQAETGWTSGLSLPAPATAIADIYGWRFAYNIGADSTDAVHVATDMFMDNAAGVDVDPGDPVAYALAVQRADTREYVEDERFYTNGETATSEYAKAQPIAEAAYTELRGKR